MKSIFKICLSSSYICAAVGCSPATQESFLAEWRGEELRFFNQVCSSKSAASGPARLSVIELNGRSLTILQPDACSSQNSKNSNLGLAGEPGRKPVYIHYGYAGNSDDDQVIHRGERDAIAWANDSFRVVNVSGMSIDRAQAAIMADRRSNPSDYDKSSHVFVDIDAHGIVGEDGLHRIGKTDETPASSTTTLVRTTDIQSALLEGVGHGAGSVVCMVQSCYSGAIKNDPAFSDLQTSKENPEQTRIFMFSSSEDQPATAYNSGMEQSMQLLTQMGSGDKGLSVAEFQSALKQKNLGSVNVNSQTVYYVPSTSISTDNPLGTPSHFGADASYVAQGPSVVGPKDALILPPGIMPGKSQPVLSEQERRAAAERAAKQTGTILDWSDSAGSL